VQWQARVLRWTVGSAGRRPSRMLGEASLALTVIAAIAIVGAPSAYAACPNEAFRAGPSAHLPDCRAYELVTPPKLNGIPLSGTGTGSLDEMFSSPSAVPGGNSFLYTLFAAGVPNTESGAYNDRYEASRTSNGWITTRNTPTPQEAMAPAGGAYNSDQPYSITFIEGFRGGSLAFCSCQPIVYVRHPDGSFHLLGEGTVPAFPDDDGFSNGFVDDPAPSPRWISEAGDHQIFQSQVQLLPEAPLGTFEVYDRTPAGLELVSVLPGGNPAPTESLFAGSSPDASTVLFTSGGSLYGRVDGERTVEIASGSSGEVLPGGVTADGTKVYFVQAGNIYVYDVAAGATSPVATPGNAILVNVSPDGEYAYFTSETTIVPEKGTPGLPNLYVWDGGRISFIATLTSEDLAHGGNPFFGLALWTKGYNERPAAENANRILNTARTTSDGRIFVFESSAQLTDYPNEGHVEIYRYDTGTEGLICVSCSPDLPASQANSELVFSGEDQGIKAFQMLDIANLSLDGQQVVFESLDALLPRDVNGVRDIYEWRAGDLSLISSGQAVQPSTLLGVTPDGSDILFETGETLVPQGQESGGLSIYDARVDGGLAVQQVRPPLDCQGEACQGEPTDPPGFSAAGSSTLRSGAGNAKARCARHGRHKRRRGKSRSSSRKHKRPCRSARRRGSK
jgi:WD40-like Beta Propeller Repeat